MDVSKCPVMHGALTSNRTTGTSNQDWWPNQLNLSILRQHGPKSDPHRGDHDYREALQIHPNGKPLELSADEWDALTHFLNSL